MADAVMNFNQDMAQLKNARSRERVDLAMDAVPGYEEVDTREKHLGEDEAILTLMRHRLNNARDWWQENHETARQDVRFAYGDQWPEGSKADRQGRPSLQFNLLPQYINQLIGQVRQSKFNLHVMQSSGMNDFAPVWAGGVASMYPIAEIMEGLIRDVERRSRADHGYARALQHAIEGGFGWLFIRTFRALDNPFDIEVRVEHVKDRWSVLMDPFSKQDDFSDASWGAITEPMPLRDFQEQYPGIPTSGFGAGSGFDGEYGRWWAGGDSVRLAHYFYKEPLKRTAVKLVSRDGAEIIEYKDNLESILDELAQGGYRKVDEIEVDAYKVKHIRCTGMSILDGPNDWPGLRIPLVPVLGREVNVDGYNYYFGLVRHAWDPQRMLNYFSSAAIERVALAPKAPWLGTAHQLAGHAADWRDQLKRPDGILMYNPDPEAKGPPERQEPASMPHAEMQIVLSMRQHVMETLGMYEASVGRRSNETSGVAIQRRQNTSQANTFAFIDNLAYSIASVGEILCDILPKIYSADQTKRIIMPDDTQANVQLNHEITDRQTGKKFKIANLGLARYTCTVRAGPSFSTVREEFVKMITELSRTNPQVMLGTLDLVINSLDIPNAREMSRRFKMMMPRHLLRPEDQANLPEPPQKPPTPEQEADMAKAQATTQKAQADVALVEKQLEIADRNLQQEQEQTRQQELKTRAEEAKLEAVTEKGAIDLENAEAEGQRESESGQDETKLRGMIRREIARAMSERIAA